MKTALAISALLVAGYVVTWKSFVVSFHGLAAAPLSLFHYAANNNTTSNTCPSSSTRFPTFGSNQHKEMCGWAYTNHTASSKNCTLLVRPRASETQGISQWIMDVVTFHLYAIQAHCHLKLDYGENVDISSILTPHNIESSWNWTVDHHADFECQPPTCHVLQSHESLETALNTTLAQVPNYRYAYSSMKYGGIPLYKDDFSTLQQALPGLDLETGVHCSLSTLFSLNLEQAQAFVPNLCSAILSKLLLSNDTLVVSLYFRTHNADFMTHVERNDEETTTMKQGVSRAMNESRYMHRVKKILDCTLQLERQHNKSVWIVISDSPSVKHYVAQHYATSSRTILTTPARGTHSRPSRTPSTIDFVDAFIDWYLIGESDIVVSDKESPTFGGTAALRTFRPYHDASTCRKLPLLHKETEKVENMKLMRKHPVRQY
jgi:hypothetical protein